jgi:hypothetical protein
LPGRGFSLLTSRCRSVAVSRGFWLVSCPSRALLTTGGCRSDPLSPVQALTGLSLRGSFLPAPPLTRHLIRRPVQAPAERRDSHGAGETPPHSARSGVEGGALGVQRARHRARPLRTSVMARYFPARSRLEQSL